MIKRLTSFLLLSLFAVVVLAQADYYKSVDGVNGGATLKTALYELIKNHKKISYGSGESSTWGAFYTTDAVVENGKRRVLDMYSAEKRYFGSKGSAVSGMNIEHSVAKSWWGGTQNNAYCDLHHLNPSDQDANSRKSNYPLGELTSVSWDNGVTFVGKANIDGNSNQNAYEPCDEYKGDFARVFMYMFTCYQDLTWKYTWMNYEKSTYPTLKPWAVELLLKWHKQDPVSEKEVNRNNAVYAVQGNRNPFVDYPQLADYVWGDSINYVFHLTGEVEDGTGSGNGGSTDGGNDGSDDVEIIDGWKIYLDENFDGSTMKFITYEGVGNYPWQLSSQYKYAIATSYVSSTNNNAESWLLSPFFDFSNDSVATVSFEYVIRYCESDKAAEHHSLMISNDFDGDVENATWEAIDFGATENTTDWKLTKTGDITIPQKYMGEKAVTLAFFYKGTTTKAGTFEIDNVVVKAMEGGNDGGNDDDNDNGDDSEDNGGNSGGNDNDGDDNEGNFTGGNFVLVTDASKLSVGDSIIIAYENYAMGASSSNGNFREKTDITVSGNSVTNISPDVQIIVLKEGVLAGTYALNVDGGYLSAASSSSNYLKTVATLDANASWKITINNNLASIIAQGSYSRNTLQYNTGSPRFSCYKSGQKDVTIYAKSSLPTGIVVNKYPDTVDVYTMTGILLRSNVEHSRATQGLRSGTYIVAGEKVLVK